MKANVKLMNELINTIKDRLIRDEECLANAISKVRSRVTDLEKVKDMSDPDALMHLFSIVDDIHSFGWYFQRTMDCVATLRASLNALNDPHHNATYVLEGEERVKAELAARAHALSKYKTQVNGTQGPQGVTV